MEPQPAEDHRSSSSSDWAEWAASGLLDAIDGAVIGTDLDGRIMYWNRGAEALYGYTKEQMVNANVVDLFVDAGNLPDAESVMAGVLAGRSWTGEFPVKTAYGYSVRVVITDSPLWRDGRVCGVIGVAVAARGDEAQASAFQAAEGRISRLARVTAELAATTDADAVTAVVIAHAADAMGATVASLSLLTGDDTMTLVGLRGGSNEAERWSTYPLSAELPTSQALRTGRIVVVAGHEQFAARYPSLPPDLPKDRAMVCLPLTVGDRRIGAISLGFTGLRVPNPQEMEFLTVFADTCAQALERIDALARAQTAAQKLSFIADVSAELADSLDYRATLTNVARLAIPVLADWCAVDILDDGVLRTLAVQHADPAKVALAEELQRRYPSDPKAATGAANVARTGRSELYVEITDEMLVAAAVDDEHLRLARQLGLASAVVVPLTARGRVLGTITLVSAESGRQYTAADVAFAEDLAGRAATAVDNAQLFTQTQEVAVQLQRAVLPDSLPVVSGWDFACHYSPAGRTEVGGDFYDIVVLPDGRVVAFVGDVMGRGVAAAAAMAQMRAAVRAYVSVDPDPLVVLNKLDNMFSLYGTAQLVTLVYVLADADRSTMTVISAGHLPPLCVDMGGDAIPIWAPIAPPLGVGGSERAAQTLTLRPGETLLAYTDGLIERRGEDIGDGIARLVGAAGVLRDGDLQEALDELAGAQVATGDDDVTALALRRPRET